MTRPDPDFCDFVRDGSPEAFARLVERHIDAVHSTARRVLGQHRSLAEDVVQLVFVRLARKGRGLPEPLVVGAWLHRQTVRIALNTVRGEARRLRRETLTIEAMETQETEPEWAEIMPHIDRAITELPKGDQEAIALRFFEGLPHRAIGERLDLSAGAVEKRISRALEKLRVQLWHRGVTPGSAALALCLAERSVEAAPAPAALAGAVVAQASPQIGAAGSHVGALTFLTCAKSFLVGSAAGLLAAGAWAITGSMPEPSTVDASAAPVAPPHPLSSEDSDPKSVERWTIPAPAFSPEAIFAQLQELLAEPDIEITRLRLRGFLGALAATDFAPLLALAEAELDGSGRARLLPDLARAWALLDPAAALAAMATSTEETDRLELQRKTLVVAAFEEWHEADPREAQRWLVAHQEVPDFEAFIPALISVVATGLVENSEADAIAWAALLDGEDYRRAALKPLWERFTETVVTGDQSPELARLFDDFATLEDGEFARFAVTELGRGWAKHRFDEFNRWADAQPPGALAYAAAAGAVELEWVARGFRRLPDQRSWGWNVSRVSHPDPTKSAERALRLSTGRPASEVVAELVRRMPDIPPDLAEWALPRLIDPERDSAILYAAQRATDARSWSSRNPPHEIALGWAVHHSEPAIRDAMIRDIYSRWLEHPMIPGAEKFVASCGWSEPLKAILQEVSAGR